MNSLSRAIMTTVGYADIFDFPLTKREIAMRLIHTQKVRQTQIDQTLEKLHQQGLLCVTGSYFHFPGRSKIIKLRSERNQESSRKIKKAKIIANSLLSLPYVRAIFLTGAVAVNNAPPEDDIDIMVITATNSLWACRLWINGWLDLHGLRRHPGDKQATDKMCPNLFLTEDNLIIPAGKRNMYTAHEVIQTIPLTDPFHLHPQFIQKNNWILRYLPHSDMPSDFSVELRTTSSKEVPQWLERVCYSFEKAYMHSKMTRETAAQTSAYFHPRDTYRMIRSELRIRQRRYFP